MGMEERIVEVSNLSKSFKDVSALHGVSFHVLRGEMLGLLGPNGAGKTTAISILLGLTTPSTGSARVFGKDPLKARAEILQRMNFSASYATLPPNLKVREALIVYGKLYNVRRLPEKIEELTGLFGIAPLIHRVVGQLSSGEQTRLNLVKSMLNDPELLLLDEPTANLDPDIAEKVRGVLRAVQKERGITILYTSHNMREVEALCHRVVFLHRGRVVAEGQPAEVVQRFGHANLEEVFIDIARTGDVKDREAQA